MKTTIILKDFSGSPLVSTPEELLPFVLLRQDTAKAIDDYRVEAVKNMVATFHGFSWCQFITDRCVGKKVKPASYTSNEEEAEELCQLETILDSFDALKNKVEVVLAGDKPVETLDSVLVGYDAEKLLVELHPLSDAEFCRHIRKHYEAGHFVEGIQGQMLRDILLQYFSDVPAREMIGAVFSVDYIEPKFTRKPRKPVTRIRKK